MFNRNEIEALVIGARMVESWGGPTLAQGARAALAKIATALPMDKRTTLESSRLFSPDFFINPQLGAQMDVLRVAIDGHRCVQIDYRDAENRASVRQVRPLGLFFWGGTWSLGAWCELRNDFRNFRLDRMVSSAVRDERFADEPGRRLADYLRAMSCNENIAPQ
jgi:predicted DNA-binding transcriptional regulator YafY